MPALFYNRPMSSLYYDVRQRNASNLHIGGAEPADAVMVISALEKDWNYRDYLFVIISLVLFFNLAIIIAALHNISLSDLFIM